MEVATEAEDLISITITEFVLNMTQTIARSMLFRYITTNTIDCLCATLGITIPSIRSKHIIILMDFLWSDIPKITLSRIRKHIIIVASESLYKMVQIIMSSIMFRRIITTMGCLSSIQAIILSIIHKRITILMESFL